MKKSVIKSKIEKQIVKEVFNMCLKNMEVNISNIPNILDNIVESVNTYEKDEISVNDKVNIEYFENISAEKLDDICALCTTWIYEDNKELYMTNNFICDMSDSNFDTKFGKVKYSEKSKQFTRITEPIIDTCSNHLTIVFTKVQDENFDVTHNIKIYEYIAC